MADIQEKSQEINFLGPDTADKIRLREGLIKAAKKAGLVLIIWLFIVSAVLGYGLILNGKNNKEQS